MSTSRDKRFKGIKLFRKKDKLRTATGTEFKILKFKDGHLKKGSSRYLASVQHGMLVSDFIHNRQVPILVMKGRLAIIVKIEVYGHIHDGPVDIMKALGINDVKEPVALYEV